MMPSGWREAILKDLVAEDRKITYGIVQPGTFDPNGIPLIRGKDYSFGWVPLDEFFRVSPEVDRPYKRSKVRPGDLLLTIVGAGTGNTAIVPSYLNDANITQTTARISVDAKKAVPMFVYHFLNSETNTRLNLRKHIKGQAQPGLNLADVEIFKVLLPPMNEQEKIAKILSTWDEAIEKIEALIISKSKKKSHYILTTMNPSQRGWKSYRVSELGELTKGKGISKSEVVGSGLSCIRYGEIYTSHDIVIRNFRSYISQDTAQNSKRLNKGDIVFAGSGETAEEIGKSVAYLGDDEAYVGGDTIVLSPSGHSSLFLSYLFNSPYTRKQLNVLGQGNAVVHLYPRDLADVTASAPELEQQLKIASYLNALDEEMLVYKRIALCLKNQKQGLMQQLLTGKKRVKV